MKNSRTTFALQLAAAELRKLSYKDSQTTRALEQIHLALEEGPQLLTALNHAAAALTTVASNLRRTDATPETLSIARFADEEFRKAYATILAVTP